MLFDYLYFKIHFRQIIDVFANFNDIIIFPYFCHKFFV